MTKKEAPTPVLSDAAGLLGDLRQLIEQSRRLVVAAVNSSLTLLYWRICLRVRSEILLGQRASYGDEIVVTLSRQFSWSHFLALLPVKDPLARDFYAQMCSMERWGVRTLRDRVDSMLFERTAMSKKPSAQFRLDQGTRDGVDEVVLSGSYSSSYPYAFGGHQANLELAS
jgi:hypothetical protein